MNRSMFALLLGVTFVVGLGLRGWNLSNPAFCLDETRQVRVAKLAPSELIETCLKQGQPPLYWLGLHGWLKLTGEREAAVRAFSVVGSGAAMIAFFILAWRLYGSSVALIALLLLCVNPMQVETARVAGPAGWVMLFACASFVGLHVLLNSNNWRGAELTVCATLLLFYTSALGLWVWAAQWLGVLLLWGLTAEVGPKVWRRWLATQALTAIGLTPWLAAWFTWLSRGGMAAGEATRPLLSEPLTFHGAMLESAGGPVLLGLLGLWAALALVRVGRRQGTWNWLRLISSLENSRWPLHFAMLRPALLLACWWGIVAALPLVWGLGLRATGLSGWDGVGLGFAAWAILAAKGWSRMIRPVLFVPLLAVLLFFSAKALQARWLCSQEASWREPIAQFEPAAQPGDLVPVCPPRSPEEAPLL